MTYVLIIFKKKKKSMIKYFPYFQITQIVYFDRITTTRCVILQTFEKRNHIFVIIKYKIRIL